jgi:hypothetical protein
VSLDAVQAAAHDHLAGWIDRDGLCGRARPDAVAGIATAADEVEELAELEESATSGRTPARAHDAVMPRPRVDVARRVRRGVR